MQACRFQRFLWKKQGADVPACGEEEKDKKRKEKKMEESKGE